MTRHGDSPARRTGGRTHPECSARRHSEARCHSSRADRRDRPPAESARRARITSGHELQSAGKLLGNRRGGQLREAAGRRFAGDVAPRHAFAPADRAIGQLAAHEHVFALLPRGRGVRERRLSGRRTTCAVSWRMRMDAAMATVEPQALSRVPAVAQLAVVRARPRSCPSVRRAPR